MLRSDFNPRDDAVVIGASMAGLLAARVLADHFARVTLVERDRLPDGPTFRTGVPQSRHLHVLLARGLEVIGQLFPGIEQELVGGAVPVEWLVGSVRHRDQDPVSKPGVSGMGRPPPPRRARLSSTGSCASARTTTRRSCPAAFSVRWRR